MAITVLLKPPITIIQLNIIHNIDRGLQERNLSFLVITEYRQYYTLPLSNLILNLGGQIKDIYLYYCNGVRGPFFSQCEWN